MEKRLSEVEKAIVRIDATLGPLQKSVERLDAGFGSLKTTIIVTGVSSVLAIVFGVGAFNVAVLSNMVASFESGKNTAQALDAASVKVEKAQAAAEAAADRLTKALERATPPATAASR